jgi:hypothetical protein
MWMNRIYTVRSEYLISFNSIMKHTRLNHPELDESLSCVVELTLYELVNTAFQVGLCSAQRTGHVMVLVRLVDNPSTDAFDSKQPAGPFPSIIAFWLVGYFVPWLGRKLGLSDPRVQELQQNINHNFVHSLGVNRICITSKIFVCWAIYIC